MRDLIAGPRGGHFQLGPAGDALVSGRRYRKASTVLETTWQVGSARLFLTEGMVAEVAGRLFPTFCLVRRIEAHGQPIKVTLCFDPRFGVERRIPSIRRGNSGLIVTDSGIALR